MDTFKKITIAATLTAGMAFTLTAQACRLSDDVVGLQLNPALSQAFQTPNTGISFGGHQFMVVKPANCYDTGAGYKSCQVLLDHLGISNGYYLVVDQTVHPKTNQVVTQVSAYRDHAKVVLGYTQPYLAGSALNVVSIKKVGV